MNYENKPCPACGSHLHESDDVVVCPVCATPQHRHCWQENGKCINEEKHAEGYIWSAEGGTFADDTPEMPGKEEAGVKICPFCSSENSTDAARCGACGASLEDAGEESTVYCSNCGLHNPPGSRICRRCGAPLAPEQAAPVFYIPELNEKIGEHSVAEIGAYVKTSVRKFLPKFRKIEEGGGKVSFNWAAFFFGHLWYFYRKMYKQGILIILALAASSLIIAGTVNECSKLYLDFYSKYSAGEMTQEETLTAYKELMDGFKAVDKRPLYVWAALAVTIRLICALFAYNMYYRKMLSDFKLISEEIEDRNMQALLISHRGGVSVLNIICAYLLYQIAGNVFTWVAQNVSQLF
ncbi:MAG: zinc ribbon domain-containing protein [Clostridia bacterium]|nr:zinc ribbon domain-containing protein [Clostridia bacterium]